MVKKKEIDKKIKEKIVKVDENSTIKDDTPSLYHYLIVILVFFGLFYGIYFMVNLTSMNSEILITPNSTEIQFEPYIYKHIVENNTYNLQFHTPIEDLENNNLLIEINKYDLLNSERIIFSFYNYNGTDNKFVSTSSVKLMKLFRYLFNFDFDANDFKLYNESNCSTSTLNEKVILFNPYSDISGIYYDSSSGCIEINAKTPTAIVSVTDIFIYTLVNE